MAFAMGAGIGGSPVLRQMYWYACRLSQPSQAHLFLLKLSISALVRLFAASRAAQFSPDST